MKNKLLRFTFASLFSLFACHNSSDVTIDYLHLLKDSVALNNYASKNFSLLLFKYFEDVRSKNEYFTYYNQSSKSIDFTFINDSSIVKKINMEAMEEVNDYVLASTDSVILFSNSKRNLAVLSPSTNTTYEIADTIPVYNGKFELNSFYSYPLSIINDELLIYNFPYEFLNNKSRFDKYYSTLRDVHLKLINNHFLISHLSGKYLDDKSAFNHHVFSPTRTIGKNNSIIYSFDDSKMILVYDNSTNINSEIELLTPGFRENEIFNQEKTRDHNYQLKYFIENDRFNVLTYDKYTDQYYRILGKGINLKNNDGTINNDKPFIIFIYDSNFKLRKEISFPPNKYNAFAIFCTKNLTYLITKNDDENQQIYLHGFDFK
jgi:hypothetical protein